MSCRFTFFLLLCLELLIEKSLSSIHFPPTRVRLQYTFLSNHLNTSVERIKRRTTSDVFQIHTHYDRSVKKLAKNEQKLIKDAVETATDYWSKTIRPKYKLNDRIRLTRQCPSRKMFIVENDSSVHYCSDNCLDVTMCGDVIVPEEHLHQCHVCKQNKKCERSGSKGYGVNAEFILYVSAMDTDRCQPKDTLATASFCQLESDHDRPIAGNINVCPQRLFGDLHSLDFDRLVSTIKHEILHTLVFSSGLYAFFRDSDGNPLTKRDPTTRWPITFDEQLQVYKPSDRVLREVVRKNWKIRGGTIKKHVSMLVTPKLREVVREHFACPTLEGAELEDQGSVGTALTHWEKRLFEHEIMTGTYTQESVISNLTLALLEDSGWYDVSYEYGKPLLWGRHLGCNFVQTSCKQWIDTKLSKKESPYPYCVTSPKPAHAKRICAYTYDKIVLCNLIEYAEPLPAEYQIFDTFPNVTDDNDLKRYGGHVILANYCPYDQELAYRNSHRDSRCYRPENQPSKEENYVLEKYSVDSKCFDFGTVWEQYIDSCTRKRRITPQSAGCYRYECVPSKGIYVHIGNQKYLCEYQGQNVTVIIGDREFVRVGSILCPDCQTICSSTNEFQCPSKSSRYSNLIDQQSTIRHTVKNLCDQLDRSTASDMNTNLRMKYSMIVFLVLLSFRQ